MADKNTSNAGNNGAANNGADANVVRLRFNRSDLVKVLITDTDFVLVFVNGRKVLIKDGAIRSTLEKNYKILFNEEEVDGSLLFSEAETAEGPVEALPWGAIPEDLMSEEALAAKAGATVLTVSVPKSGFGNLGLVGGALGALGLAGGGGGAAAVATVGAPALTATAMKGPFVGSNLVDVYDLSGNRLASGRLQDGKVTLSLPDGYRGLVMIQVQSNGGASDYRDEKTGELVALNTQFGLRAFVLVEPGVQNSATVSPLTELAVRNVLEDRPVPTAEEPVLAADAQAANQRVGLLVGLSDITGPVVPMIDPNGDINPLFTGDSANAAQLYGAILAQFSGMLSDDTPLENVLNAMAPMVEQLRLAQASGDAQAESAAKLAIVDQFAVGAKLVPDAVASTHPDIAQKLATVAVQEARVLREPPQVVQNGIKAQQETATALGDGLLNAIEKGQIQ